MPPGVRGCARDDIASTVEHTIAIDILEGRTEQLESAFWTVVHHRMIDALRREKRVERTHDRARARVEEEQVFDESESNEGWIEEVAIQNALFDLPPRAYHALLLYHRLGLEIFSKDAAAKTVSSLLRTSERSTRRLIKSAEGLLRSQLKNR